MPTMALSRDIGGKLMGVKNRRALLIFISGFGTYLLLMRPVGFIYSLLIGFAVAAMVVGIDELIRSRRSRRRMQLGASEADSNRG
ncbi:hypothetical protein [Arthrobacter sp. 18067]|uniref:hypothetical protein n=1 Tax=Arthrobacter sp. 18067 TaxID=2681413 RepID=UPI00135A5A02|nr:hypothetical protein [Arthrobacter sp. 18067]